jgi:hypothetical protein
LNLIAKVFKSIFGLFLISFFILSCTRTKFSSVSETDLSGISLEANCKIGFVSKNGQCVTDSCTLGEIQNCEDLTGTGKKFCTSTSEGQIFGSCQMTNCKSGYILQNKVCVKTVREVGICSPNSSVVCSENNGSGIKTCNMAGSGYGSCAINACNAGYTLTNGVCTVTPKFCSPNSSVVCSENNGSGIKTCNMAGSGYGSCAINACNAGYTLTNGVCVQNVVIQQKPAARGQVLGSCLYQLGENFLPISSRGVDAKIDPKWPMLSCANDMNVTCAAGFEKISDAPVQMNCSSSPSTNLTNCYWIKYRCIRSAGSMELQNFTKGKSYGHCLQKYNGSFQVTETTDVKWPMLSCDGQGKPTCVSGFKPFKEAPIQMNCSSAPSKFNTDNCYWMSMKCIKQ